jgi:conjugal transfer pilus assembly protein TrbC
MEEKKLLRPLIKISIPLVILFTFNVSFAQELDEQNKVPIEFADDAQGDIAPPIMTMLNKAEQRANEIRSQVQIQEPNNFGVEPNIDELRDKALNNPRVQALLGADGKNIDGELTEARYGNDQILLFASFSMPEKALRSLMIEADRFNVPIVFRGFVNNSSLDTQIAIEKVFGNDIESIGFTIDPTLFTRFNIEAVPQVVVTKFPLNPCETQGCKNDTVPLHDIVRGNIPVEAALRIIAKGNGDAPNAAIEALGSAL